MTPTQQRLLVIAAAALVLAGALAVVVSRLDVNRYRGQMEAALAARLHREVSIGHIAASVRPPGIRVENGVIGEDPAFDTGRPFARADEIYVTLAPLALLRGRVDVRSVDLRRPQIELVRNSAGVWNVSSLGEGGAATLAPKRLVVTVGEVAVTDLAARDAGRAVYRNIDVRLDDYASGRPFQLLLTVALPGPEGQRVSLRGQAGPIPAGQIARTPFAGEAEFENASISGLRRFLQLDALRAFDAIVTGTLVVQASREQMSSHGALHFDAARVNGTELGCPIGATFDLAHDANTKMLSVKTATLRLNATPVMLDGAVHLQPDGPLLDLHIRVADASVTESARLASASGIAFGAGTDVEGRLTADMRAHGPAGRPALHGELQLRDVKISKKEWAQPVRTPFVQLALTPRAIRSNDFTADTNGTSVAARFTLTDYTSNAPAVDATIRAQDADIRDALEVARAWGVHAGDGLGGSGRVTVDVRATGRASALEYTGSAAFRDATLTTPLFTQPLRLRAASVSFARRAAVVRGIDAGIGGMTARGNLTVRNFASPDVEFDLSIDTMDLAAMQALIAESKRTPPGHADEPRQAAEGHASLLQRLAGSGRLRAGALRYDQLLLENVQADARLDRGVITLQPLTATVFGGQHRGSIAIDAARTPTAFAVVSDFRRVDANRLASATTSLKDVLYGTLNSADRVTFTTDGAGSIASSLNGTLSLQIPDGRIAHMDLIHQVGVVAGFIKGPRIDQQITRVRNLSAHFTVTRGLARTSDLTANIGDDATIGGDGSINLVTQDLHLRLVAVLSREFSAGVGGTRVGGIMSTVLANRRGELVVPIVVTGTTQHPQFAPDVERMAEMKLRNMVPDTRGELPPVLKPEPGEPAQQLEELLRAILGGGRKKE